MIIFVLLAAVWIPFLGTDHSLTNDTHSPFAFSEHMELHHQGDELEQDHSHPADHDHDDQYLFTKVIFLIAPLLVLIAIPLIPTKLSSHSLAKSNSSISLQHTLSRHKTIVLLN